MLKLSNLYACMHACLPACMYVWIKFNMWATANLQQTREAQGEENVNTAQATGVAKDLGSDATLALWTLLGQPKRNKNVEHDKVPLEPASIYIYLYPVPIYLRVLHRSMLVLTIWIYLTWINPLFLWVVDLQASLIATILSNGSMAESMVKASWGSLGQLGDGSKRVKTHQWPIVDSKKTDSWWLMDVHLSKSMDTCRDLFIFVPFLQCQDLRKTCRTSPYIWEANSMPAKISLKTKPLNSRVGGVP